jgi:SAM-dependent methyltransferase
MSMDLSLRAKWGRFTHTIDSLRREQGLGAALGTAVTWSGAFLRKQALETSYRIRDARTGLDTASDFPEAEHPENPTHDDAMHYMGVPPRIFRKLVRDLGVAPAEYTFVDLGCGKGAALLMAADRGFASVVGVELNSRLVPVAERNAAAYVRRGSAVSPIQVIHGDAVAFEFPKAPTVLFMFNPFGADTLRDVLDKLEASLRENPRDVAIGYVSPVHAELLDRSPLFERLPSRSPRWAAYRSVTADR